VRGDQTDLFYRLEVVVIFASTLMHLPFVFDDNEHFFWVGKRLAALKRLNHFNAKLSDDIFYIYTRGSSAQLDTCILLAILCQEV